MNAFWSLTLVLTYQLASTKTEAISVLVSVVTAEIAVQIQ